jgi:hypothetical protein
MRLDSYRDTAVKNKRDRLSRTRAAAAKLQPGDMEMLKNCVDYCGGGAPGFKALLLGSLERGYDFHRKNRLISVIKHLSEAEIIALIDGE